MNRYKYIDGKGEHRHELDDRPLLGTSTISDLIPPPLTWWASGLAVRVLGVPDAKVFTKIKAKKATQEEIDALNSSCATRLDEIKGMTTEDYVKLLNDAYKAHSVKLKDSAKAGTDLHAELERYVKNHMITNGVAKDTSTYDIKIQPFISWSEKNVKRFIYSEANCFSEKMWTGGISDACSELNDGNVIVIDFKSAKDAYLTKFWQAVGYAIQVEENGWYDKDGNLLGKLEKPIDYVCVVPFGAEIVEPKFYYNMEEGKKAFQLMTDLYKLYNQ